MRMFFLSVTDAEKSDLFFAHGSGFVSLETDRNADSDPTAMIRSEEKI